MVNMEIGVLFLKLLLYGGLLHVATSKYMPVNPELVGQIEQMNYLLPRNAAPLHYNIKLSLYDNHVMSTMQGESNITIEVYHTSSHISLHMRHISLIEIVLIDKTGKDFESLGFNYIGMNIIVLEFNEAIPKGVYTLYLKYVNYLFENGEFDGTNGILNTSYIDQKGNKILQIATLSYPCWVRRLFPCWDEPGFEATFNISVRHRMDYSALSNAPVKEEYNGMKWNGNGNGNEMVWTHFHKTIPMPAYRLTLAIIMSRMIHISNTNETIYMWCNPKLLPELKFALDIVEQIKSKIDWYSRSNHEMRNLNFVAIAGFSEKTIGNWGITLHREAHLLYNQHDGLMRKIEVARVVARAAAYQWLDNVFTPNWWSDLWFSEGLAILVQVNALHKIFPNWRVPELFVVQTQHEALHSDTFYHMNPLVYSVKSASDIASILSSSFYVKAPAIMRMLQHIITDVKNNPDAMYEYFKTNQVKGQSAETMWLNMEKVLNPSQMKNYKLNVIMDSWTKYQLYPTVKVIRNYDNGTITIIQEHKSKFEVRHKWWVPLTYTAQSHLDFSSTLPRLWLTPDIKTIHLDRGYSKNDWIIFNLQQTGYYRVNYDIENWALIAGFLNKQDYTKIHVLNRAKLIDDAYHFLVRKQLPLSMFLELTKYLSRERDYVAWYPMIKILEYLSVYIPYKESENLQKHARKILKDLLSEIKYTESQEDDLLNCLRQDAARLACAYGESSCNDMAYERILMYMENPNILKPDWKFWAFCNGLKIVEDELWDYELSFDAGFNKLIDYFHCPGVSIINHHHRLNAYKMKTKNLVTNTTIYSIGVYARAHLKNALDQLICYRARFAIKAIIAIINRTYSQTELNQIYEFVKHHLSKEKQLTQETIKNIHHTISKRTYHINKQLKNLARWNTMYV